jgi:hypothetical protein
VTPFDAVRLTAPVHLPQGAKITAIKLFYDNTAGSAGGSSLQLSVVTMAGAGQYYGFAVGGTTAGFGQVSSAITPALAVDNTKYAYSFYWNAAAADNSIMGAEVDYTLP